MLNMHIRPTVLAAILSAIVLASLGAITLGHAANIYIWRDSDGTRHYSDACPPDADCRVKVVRSSERKNRKSRNNDSSTTSSSDTDTAISDPTPTTDTTATSDTTSSSDTSTQTSTDRTATLKWDAVDDANLAGYRVYYAAAGTYYQPLGQGIDVGNATTHTVTSLSSGTRYYFRVTAFDTSDNESTFSNEVFKDID